MRKIFQNNDKDGELPGVGMTFEEALDNLRFEKDRREKKIKRLESQLENRSLSEEEKEELMKIKSHHDEWKDLIEDTLENTD